MVASGHFGLFRIHTKPSHTGVARAATWYFCDRLENFHGESVLRRSAHQAQVYIRYHLTSDIRTVCDQRFQSSNQILTAWTRGLPDSILVVHRACLAIRQLL